MNAPHKPLVVIVSVTKNTKEKVSDKVKEIGKKWRVSKSNKGGRDIVFTWMDADKWATWLSNMYGIKAGNEPTVVIADHSVSSAKACGLFLLISLFFFAEVLVL